MQAPFGALCVALAFLFLPLMLTANASAQVAWFPETVDRGDSVGMHASLVIDSRDRPHISYIDEGNGTLKYAVQESGVWRTEIVAPVRFIAGPTSLALDPVGRPHISFVDGVTLRYASFDGSRWNVSSVDLAYEEGTNSLALGQDGLPRIAYAWDTGLLRIAQWDGARWVRLTVEAETIIARYVSLALDAIDSPQISYFGNGMLRYSIWRGGAWTTETVDSGEGSGWFSQMVLDERGWPRIAYYDSGRRDLRFASWDGTRSSWSLEVVDSAGEPGWDLDLALDAVGAPHVSYYERLSSEVRYARKLGSAWEIQTVDSAGEVGWYTSIALNGAGSPSMVYFDWTNGALRFAAGRIEFQVRTFAVESIGPTRATLRAELACLAQFLSANVSFEWRAQGTVTWNRTAAGAFAAPSTLRYSLTNLTPDSTYEARAVADADGLEVRGETITFRTVGLPPPQASPFWVVLTGVGITAGFVLFLLVLRRRKAALPLGLRGEMAGDEMPGPKFP